MCSDNDDYKFDLAMCLYKACDYQGAIKASYSVQSAKYANKVNQLQAAIKYMEDDLPAAKALIEKQSEEDEEAVTNRYILASYVSMGLYRVGGLPKWVSFEIGPIESNLRPAQLGLI